MPACASCSYLDPYNKQCKAAHKHKPLRNCIEPINEGYHRQFFSGCRVLEIGCGAWSPMRVYCEKINATWEGIDVLEEYLGKKTIATRIASVENIPFADSHFDFVVANQSMEHWEENFVPLLKGLSEVFRVLKPGGKVLFNVPMYFHGGFLFVSGDLDGIRNLFEPFASDVQLERWRNPAQPIQEIFQLNRLFWFNRKLRDKPAHILDIQATKRAVVPYFNPRPMSKAGKLWTGLRERGLLYYLTVVFLMVRSKLPMK